LAGILMPAKGRRTWLRTQVVTRCARDIPAPRWGLCPKRGGGRVRHGRSIPALQRVLFDEHEGAGAHVLGEGEGVGGHQAGAETGEEGGGAGELLLQVSEAGGVPRGWHAGSVPHRSSPRGRGSHRGALVGDEVPAGAGEGEAVLEEAREGGDGSA